MVVSDFRHFDFKVWGCSFTLNPPKTVNYPKEIPFLSLKNLPATLEKLCPVIVFKVLDKTAASIFHYCKLLGKELSQNMGHRCPHVFMNR